MSFSNKLTTAGLSLGLAMAFGSLAFAQTTQPAPPPSPSSGNAQSERRGMGKHHRQMGEGHKGEGREGMGGLRLMRELDLTDAQKQQARVIRERYTASTKTQREELRQLHEQKKQGTLPADAKTKAEALRTQLAESNKQMHNEMLAILTPEQRTKLETLEKERKSERREHRRGGRDGKKDEGQTSVQ